MTKTGIAQAFARRKPGRCHNAHTDGSTYVLHTSPIATWVDNQVQFYWHGYYTPTTASHMNDILRALGAGFRVSYAAARDSKATHFVWEM